MCLFVSLDHPREAEQHSRARSLNQGSMDLLFWELGQREFPGVGEGLEYLHSFFHKDTQINSCTGSAPSVGGHGQTLSPPHHKSLMWLFPT